MQTRDESQLQTLRRHDPSMVSESHSFDMESIRTNNDQDYKTVPEAIKHMGLWYSEEGISNAQVSSRGSERGYCDACALANTRSSLTAQAAQSLDPAAARQRRLLDKPKDWMRNSRIDVLVAKASTRLKRKIINGPSTNELPKVTSRREPHLPRSSGPYHNRNLAGVNRNETNFNNDDGPSENGFAQRPSGNLEIYRQRDDPNDEARFACVCHRCADPRVCDWTSCHKKHKFVSSLK